MDDQQHARCACPQNHRTPRPGMERARRRPVLPVKNGVPDSVDYTRPRSLRPSLLASKSTARRLSQRSPQMGLQLHREGCPRECATATRLERQHRWSRTTQPASRFLIRFDSHARKLEVQQSRTPRMSRVQPYLSSRRQRLGVIRAERNTNGAEVCGLTAWDVYPSPCALPGCYVIQRQRPTSVDESPAPRRSTFFVLYCS